MTDQSPRTGSWDESRIPDQSGRTVLVTGANSGLGLRTASVLAGKGAHVLLACRSPERGQSALDAVTRQATGSKPRLVQLDLGDLTAVRDSAGEIREITGDRLDVLVNNAGIMAVPKSATKDGFELQFGTNHLGHAALTWLLMPALRGSETGARVVSVSSIAATQARIDLDDPNYERRTYNPWGAYGQSKLANQVFALELHRRLHAAGERVSSVAAHPGLTATGLAGSMAGSYRNPLVSGVLRAGSWFSDAVLAQSVDRGALPQLHAATAPEVESGQYFGPDGFRQMRGAPTAVKPLRPARDTELGDRFWELTARLTGVTPDPHGRR
ncbi:NAD(P)-dependent dehydrogenase, short-chain alcohol dehydrogenase family [Haloechinothrix alba]|uniref:NAD(P)-dependent dehydrogenase, short-chain alcohol dehydrogenase family n=1 Tax=Haloechinothrix alba TaxID=664784 RepID=A0A238WH65_9PSEU|nr:oxidoreductase [Haloechinothrix alba]SNR45912.1 NAD(P)-dependent dehydrogenase, short-chain alcohol dehydrogenase family [Haloechinothrix alba]